MGGDVVVYPLSWLVIGIDRAFALPISEVRSDRLLLQ